MTCVSALVSLLTVLELFPEREKRVIDCCRHPDYLTRWFANNCMYIRSIWELENAYVSSHLDQWHWNLWALTPISTAD